MTQTARDHLAFIEDKLNKKTEERDRLREELFKGSQQLQELLAEVEHFAGVRTSLRRELNLPDESPSQSPSQPPSHTKSFSASSSASPSPEPSEDISRTRTEIILDMVRGSGVKGISAKSINDALKREGIRVHQNYVSSILSKGYREGRLGRTADAKYFVKP